MCMYAYPFAYICTHTHIYLYVFMLFLFIAYVAQRGYPFFPYIHDFLVRASAVNIEFSKTEINSAIGTPCLIFSNY